MTIVERPAHRKSVWKLLWKFCVPTIHGAAACTPCEFRAMGDALHDFTVRFNLMNLLNLMGTRKHHCFIWIQRTACHLNVSMLVLQRTNHAVVLSVRFPPCPCECRSSQPLYRPPLMTSPRGSNLCTTNTFSSTSFWCVFLRTLQLTSSLKYKKCKGANGVSFLRSAFLLTFLSLVGFLEFLKFSFRLSSVLKLSSLPRNGPTMLSRGDQPPGRPCRKVVTWRCRWPQLFRVRIRRPSVLSKKFTYFIIVVSYVYNDD